MKLIRDQLAYLRDRAAAIASGAQKLDGSLRQRAGLYANAAKTAFWQAVGKQQQDSGQQRERNVMSGSEHCDGCIEETARGWVAIGELVPIGERDCGSRCNCSIEYDDGSTDSEAA